MKMSTSKLDAVYRSILLTKFFTKGWGKPENLRRLFEFRKVVSNRDECYKLVERDYPVTITKEQTLTDCKLLEGYFTSPLERYLPGIVPEIAQKAHFQVLMPVHWPERGVKPMCLHLAGTGDHFFWRRRNLMVKPLLKEAGIGGIILENPFYGLRKPTDQVRSSLHNVSDIFVMGGCLILESLVLFHWCERNGLGPLGVTGLSMGGHMASLAATNWPKPLVLVPCLSWSTASAVFLQGVMSHSINWDLLEDQYLSDGEYREKLSKMVTIVDEAFLAGKKFARTYSQTVERVDTIKQEELQKIEKPKMPALRDAKMSALSEAKTVDEADHEIVDVSKNVLELGQMPENVVKSEMFEQIENLNKELRKLLDGNKISKVLYNKLTSNQKFELEPKDIEIINKISESNLKELLLKCKIGNINRDPPSRRDPPPPAAPDNTPSNITEDKSPPKGEEKVIESKSPEATLATRTEKPLETTLATPAEKSSETTLATPADTASETTVATPAEKSSEATALATPGEKSVKVQKERKSWNVSDLTSDLWINLPFMRSGKKIDISKIHWRDREALQFMRGIMDECTHLSNFSVPYDTSLIIAVCAKHDAYVPRDDVGTLEEIWPGAEVRYVDAGHVSAYILHQSLFRSCIREAFERSKKKWKDGKHVK